jgi:hypothetical protein
MSLILDGTNGLSDVDGSAATPAIRGSDANTGVFFGSDVVGLSTGGSERVRVDASGNVGIGTSSPNLNGFNKELTVSAGTSGTARAGINIQGSRTTDSTFGALSYYHQANLVGSIEMIRGGADNSGAMQFFTANAGSLAERMRITSSGDLLVGKTGTGGSVLGVQLEAGGAILGTVATGAGFALLANRQDDDGVLVSLRQANTQEGNISVSGTTVSYNGGHLSRWAQTTTAKDETLVKGTVLSNLDEMNVYTDADGNPVENEQLNKVKVSDVEGDANVAGVFVNWTHDDAHNVDEINMAMTGDMIIRIAEGVTVARGDLLMSAGDGTAKPQGDDIVRSKTIAKVTSTHVTCTYADGSFCVPCVLMAC